MCGFFKILITQPEYSIDIRQAFAIVQMKREGLISVTVSFAAFKYSKITIARGIRKLQHEKPLTLLVASFTSEKYVVKNSSNSFMVEGQHLLMVALEELTGNTLCVLEIYLKVTNECPQILKILRCCHFWT